ncbi:MULTISPECIES: S24 family peptidase [Acinetobacter]|uniref:S24 family peptidase n=1 Tax=Acinetobacter TaxID=469 RepID=UPI0020973774|nr:S24 family peptidase [Acinetobacter lwoffii]MCO8081971.1 helix-turn-helix domain-containing protein [Acinetobacter lwoffii]UVB01383.1 putative transcriptional regulator [Acinetobacter lwoffii]
MNEVRDRIIQRMNELGLKQADLVTRLNVSKGAVSKWVSGLNTPNSTILPQLADALETTPSWLINGTQKLKNDVSIISVEAWDSDTLVEIDEIEIPFFKDFSFACGSGSIGVAMASEKRKLRISKLTLRNRAIEQRNAIATLASGDSMTPTIKDGDTIYIDLGRKTIKDGKMFALCHGGLFMAKRLYNLPMGGVRIVSDNAAEYPEIHLTAEKIIEQQFEIIGWIWQVATLENW